MDLSDFVFKKQFVERVWKSSKKQLNKLFMLGFHSLDCVYHLCVFLSMWIVFLSTCEYWPIICPFLLLFNHMYVFAHLCLPIGLFILLYVFVLLYMFVLLNLFVLMFVFVPLYVFVLLYLFVNMYVTIGPLFFIQLSAAQIFVCFYCELVPRAYLYSSQHTVPF